ncbi:hypothetical protein CQW23_02274 [Capsicum baccatum]|uniref:RING finger and CHY zinc finger domain-containing protein 1 n=1 Tax=Capsicum baccatum TaxID=33114 RepID=A0A2G2XRC7_CAPBA|nr:hypothetical protein CQW23_02274 [Capsicum baccatum]
MRQRYLPETYRHEVLAKSYNLRKGRKSVMAYYDEFQQLMLKLNHRGEQVNDDIVRFKQQQLLLHQLEIPRFVAKTATGVVDTVEDKFLADIHVIETQEPNSRAHPNHDKFINKKIDMFDKMSLVCGNDRAREIVLSYLKIDFECFSEKDNDNDIEGPSTKKDVQLIEASQFKASRKRKRSFEVQDVVGDILIKFGEVAMTIGRMVNSRLNMTKLYEEVMAMEDASTIGEDARLEPLAAMRSLIAAIVTMKPRHELVRQAVTQVICSVCDTEQPVAHVCTNCGVNMGEYFCEVCKFYDDDIDKGQFHCDDCGICRVGGRENFFHCHKCDSCYSVSLRNNHSCVEDSMRHHCPICYEFLFDSMKDTTVMKCGHTMHTECYYEMIKRDKYCCPICSRSIIDMSKAWKQMDEELMAVLCISNLKESYPKTGRGIMASKAQNGKDVVAPSESSKKRVCQTTHVSRSPPVPRGQTHRYGSRWVEEAGKKWYNKHTESKYAPDKFIDQESFHIEFLSMDPRDPSSEVKIHGQVMTFGAHNLNAILGTPEVDSLQLRQLNITLLYAYIRHLLCGNRSTTR